jgi:integrase
VSHVYITRRRTGAGERRYVVRYRWGGRAYRLVHLGSKRTEKEARGLRDWAAGELAAGRDPRKELRRLQQASTQRSTVTVDAWFRRWIDSRIDVEEKTKKLDTNAADRFKPVIGELEVSELTLADVQEAVAKLADELEPTTVRKYLSSLRLAIDFAGTEPNPARDRRLRVPKPVKAERDPPSAANVLAILERVPERLRLALVTIEQTGLRVNESTITWADVDVVGRRFRVPARKTKSKRPKWVPVPRWLLDVIAWTCPLEDRLADRAVFPGVTDDQLRRAMTRACKTAEIASFSPHDLRHRRITLWHYEGVTPREVSDRVGHAWLSTTLDTYTHSMRPDPIPKKALLALLQPRGEVWVRS